MTTAIIIAAALIFIVGLFAVIVERTEERDEARKDARLARLHAGVWNAKAFSLETERDSWKFKAASLETERDHLDADNVRMACRLAELELLAGSTPPALTIVPPVRVSGRAQIVPPQRDGSEYEWPIVAREIKADDLTALMRATEEK